MYAKPWSEANTVSGDSREVATFWLDLEICSGPISQVSVGYREGTVCSPMTEHGWP